MRVLTLDKNNVKSIDKGYFRRSLFSSLTYVYLRKNPNLECESLLKNIPKGITPITDCRFTTMASAGHTWQTTSGTFSKDNVTTIAAPTISTFYTYNGTTFTIPTEGSNQFMKGLTLASGLLGIITVLAGLIAGSMGVYYKLKSCAKRQRLAGQTAAFEMYAFDQPADMEQEESGV